MLSTYRSSLEWVCVGVGVGVWVGGVLATIRQLCVALRLYMYSEINYGLSKAEI